jgi:hypothetical protein
MLRLNVAIARLRHNKFDSEANRESCSAMNVYFADVFNVDPKELQAYGTFNISLVSDMPLFVDPFLLFNSTKPIYKKLHSKIIEYMLFLKHKAQNEQDEGMLKAWYVFKEVDQNWLGFSVTGNKGHGLGMDFAKSLNENLHLIFREFGNEQITRSSHLEKLCLIKSGVGRDCISDFTTNLIKEYLLEYTQEFAQEHIDESMRDEFRVPRTGFNYHTETWEERTYVLPVFNSDFVLLTPKNLLTKDDTWINRNDLLDEFDRIPIAIPNPQLRAQINNYFYSRLVVDENDKGPSKEERRAAAAATIREFPEVIDYYIKDKEDHGDQAESMSKQKVAFCESIFVENVKMFIAGLKQTNFYATANDSYTEAMNKIRILKEYIENNDGYQLFYNRNERIGTEKELQLLFGLVCHESSAFDVNREVNNGRGSVDFKISKGSADKTLVEFKLASNKQLKRNLSGQVQVYEKANRTTSSIKVILYFEEKEHERASKILSELGMLEEENVVLIDARKDNKVSASKV